MDLADLRVHVGADTTEAEAGLARLSSSVGSFTQSIAAGLGAGVGFFGLEEGVRALGAAISDTTGAWARFQTLTSQAVVFTGAQESISQLQKDLIGLTQQLPVSANELAQAAYFVNTTFHDASEQMTILTAASKMAAVGMGNVKDNALFLVNTLHDYGLQVDDVSKLTNILAVATVEGHAQISQLIPAIQQIIPIASQWGISFDQVAASIAAGTTAGIPANKMFTEMRQLMVSLQAPTRQQYEELAKLGLSVDDVVKSIREKGFLQTVQDLVERTNGDTEALRQLIPNIRAMTGAMAITAGQSPTYIKMLEDMKNGVFDFNDVVEQFSHNFEFQWGLFKNNLAAGGLAVGQFIGNAVEPLLEIANDTLPVAMQRAGQAVDGFGSKFSILGQAWDAALNQIKQGDISGAFQTMEDGLGNELQAMVGDVANFAEGFFQGGANLVTSLAGGMTSAASGVLQAAIDGIANLIASFLMGFSPPKQGPLSTIDKGGENVMKAYVQGLQSGTSDLPSLVEDYIKKPFDQALDGLNSHVAAIGTIKGAIQDVTGEINTYGAAVQGIKDYYDPLIQAEQDQVDKLRDAVDFTQQLADLELQRSDLAAKQEEITAKGDPTKRADINAQIQMLQFDKEHHDNLARLDSLRSNKGGNKSEEAAAAEDESKLIGLREQLYNLTDRGKLAEATKTLEINKLQEEQNKLTEQTKKIHDEIDLQPHLKAIRDMKDAEKDRIEPLQQSLNLLQEQKKIYDQMKSEAGGGGGGGGGGGAHLPVVTPHPVDFQALMDKIKGPMNEAASKAGQEMGQKIMDGMSNFIGSHLGGGIGAAIGAALGFSLLGPIGIPIGAALGGFIGQGVQNELGKLGGPQLWEHFKQTAVSAFEGVYKEAQPYLAQLGTDVQTWQQRVQTFWEQHHTQVEGGVRVFWQDIKNTAGSGMRVNADVIKVGIDLVSGNWGKSWEDMKTTFGDFTTGLKNFAMPAFQALQATFGTGMSALGTTVSTNLTNLKSATWDPAMQHLHDFAKEQWDKIPPDIRTDLELVVTTAETKAGAMVGSWKTNLGHMVSQGKTSTGEMLTDWGRHWTTLNSNSEAFWSTNLVNMTTWLGKEKDALTTMIEPMTKEAAKIAEGIISGIADWLGQQGQRVSDAAGNMVRDALTAAKNALGIHSPSTEFQNVGEMMIQGIINGIKNKASELFQALKDALGDLIRNALHLGGGGGGNPTPADLAKGNKQFIDPNNNQPTETNTGITNPTYNPAGPTSSGGGVNVQGAASGAYVPAQPGGMIMRVGEGSEDEVVSPVSWLRSLLNPGAVPLASRGGDNNSETIIIHVNAPVYGVDHLQDTVISALQKAGRRGRRLNLTTIGVNVPA